MLHVGSDLDRKTVLRACRLRAGTRLLTRRNAEVSRVGAHSVFVPVNAGHPADRDPGARMVQYGPCQPWAERPVLVQSPELRISPRWSNGCGARSRQAMSGGTG